MRTKIPAVRISGVLPDKNVDFTTAKKHLKFETELHLYFNKAGGRTFWDYKPSKIATTEKSDYYISIKQGATIVPRPFWFIGIQKNPAFGLDKTAPYVKTSERAAKLAKPAYKNVRLSDQIESRFLFGTLTGTELVPFGFTRMIPIISPLEVNKNKFCIVTKDDAKIKGYLKLFSWLNECEVLWSKKRGEKSQKLTIYQRLNYSNGITNQNPKSKFKVLYNTSGTYLVSAILDASSRLSLIFDDCKISLNGFIADAKVYYFETDVKDEAIYLCTVLNSSYIDNQIKPMQSKGNFGERDIHKKPFELPIPKYSPSNLKHAQLVKLGNECQKKVDKHLQSLSQKYNNLGKIRSKLREILKSEIREIDKLVKDIMMSRTKTKGLSDF